MDSSGALYGATALGGTYGHPNVSLFLSGLPLWAAAILLVIVPTIAAMCGPVLIRRRIGLERLTTNNEIAGFKFATVGVIYAVLLALAVIIVWERFSEAESAVATEAGAAATVYRLTAGADAEAAATRAALTRYLSVVIERDWSQMAHEDASREANEALNAVYASTLALVQAGSRHQAVLSATFSQLDEITAARRSRLHLAHGIVPSMLWVVLVIGGL